MRGPIDRSEGALRSPSHLLDASANRLAALGDAQLATLLGAVLFVVAAWPLLLTEQLPFQDLPNHLATAEVLLHRDLYPELAFNGFWKTNAALTAWLFLAGHVVALPLAAKLFTAMTLAATSFVLPRFVLVFAGRGRMVSATFFAWPMAHHWFVAMGMLNFALAIPIAVIVLLVLRAQSLAPTPRRGALIAVLALVLWYAHVFVLAVVGLLVVLHAITRASWKERATQAIALLLPLAPAGLLIVASVTERLSTRADAVVKSFPVGFHGPLDLAYNFWSELYGVFTPLSVPSAVASIALAWIAWSRRRETPLFFGPIALLVLAAAYLFAPYNAFNWAYLNSRFLPLLYLAAFLRVPESLPRRAAVALGACAIAYSVGLGVDYVRLDRDRARFTAGIGAVPERARLLPLLFRTRVTSDNTWSLLHAWGYYVLAKHTSAPFLFADSRSYPVTERAPPPPIVARALDIARLADAESFCRRVRGEGVVVADCDAAWRAEWASFWSEAAARFDHVLVWYAPDAVLTTVPPAYRVAFRSDPLVVLERAP